MAVIQQSRRPRIRLGEDNNALTWLIIINAIVFIAINFIKVFYTVTEIPVEYFYRDILKWFELPATLKAFYSAPFTIFTYMFSHETFWQIIGSMLWLWCFGYILQDLAGNNKLIPLYLYGGIIGGIAFLLTINFLPSFHSTLFGGGYFIGASCAIITIAVATTVLSPGYRIFPMLNGGIPLWILTAIFIVIDYTTIAASNPGIAAAHFAAALTGFIFTNQLQKGNDLSLWMISFFNWLKDLFNPEKKLRNELKRQRHFYKVTRKPYEITPHVTQQKLDEILDKINQKGYDHLTTQEKDFLRKASEENLS